MQKFQSKAILKIKSKTTLKLMIQSNVILNRAFNLIKRSGFAMRDLIRHDGIEHAGYLAFLVMVGVFPFILFLVHIINILNKLYFDSQLYNFFIYVLLDRQWSDLIVALKPHIIEITNSPPGNLLTLVIFSAIWTASSIFEGLRTILNRAYRVKIIPPYLLGRAMSIIKFIITTSGIGIAIMIFTLLPSFFKFIDKNILFYISNIKNINLNILYKGMLYNAFMKYLPLNQILTALILIIFVAYLYYSIPNRKQNFLKVLPGTIITIIGWWLCSYALKYYIATFPQINFIYGSIAGIIVALLYFYICSCIYIYGAEFNYQYEEWLKHDKN